MFFFIYSDQNRHFKIAMICSKVITADGDFAHFMAILKNDRENKTKIATVVREVHFPLQNKGFFKIAISFSKSPLP